MSAPELFTALQACSSGCANSSQLRCLCANSSAACAQRSHKGQQPPGHTTASQHGTLHAHAHHFMTFVLIVGQACSRHVHVTSAGVAPAAHASQPPRGRPRALLGLAVAQRGVQLRQRVAQVQDLRARVRGVGLGSRQRRAQLAQLVRRQRARRLALRLTPRASAALSARQRAPGSASSRLPVSSGVPAVECSYVLCCLTPRRRARADACNLVAYASAAGGTGCALSKEGDCPQAQAGAQTSHRPCECTQRQTATHRHELVKPGPAGARGR